MEQTFTVKKNQTAKELGSGSLQVLGTPALVAMIENACLNSISSYLKEGETTVGIKMNLDHLKGGLVGEKIKIKTELLKTGKTSFLFAFSAFNKGELIAEGQHLRVKVDETAFMENLTKK